MIITYIILALFALLALFFIMVYLSKVENFRPGVTAPYFNYNVHLLEKQKPHKFSLLRYLP